MTEAATPGASSTDDLRRLVQQYEVMLANVSDTVVLVDRNGRIRMTTGLRSAMLGYGDGYWEDHGLLDVVHPDDLPEVLRIREQLGIHKDDPVTFQVRMQHQDGNWVHIEVTAVDCSEEPLTDDVVLTVRDVTERLRIRAQLEEQAHQQVELVGRVSHELRNPVHALQGLVELLITTDLPATAQELVRSANRQTSLLGRIVDDLLEYARLEAGRPEPSPRPTDLRDLLNDATELAAEVCRSGVTVGGDVSPDTPATVMIDGPRVAQVLSNLATNAAKFTASGSISITLQPLHGAEGWVRFEVLDTGPGIDEVEMERLWRPFEQGTPDTATRHGGAGLGLAITRGLVDMLGGDVNVSSTVGVGTCFTIDLPAPATTEDPRRHVLRPDVPRHARVLVVEDNPTNQLLVKEQLSRLNVNATVVGTGEDAVDALVPGHPYSLVLMDWQLPGIDGLEATRRARAAETADRHTPILAMTASAMPADAQQCRDAGMDDMLIKPVGLQALATAIQRWADVPDIDDDAESAAPNARIDPAALDVLADDLGGVAPVRSIVQTYLNELTRRRAAVAIAVEENEHDELRRAAHSLKATSATLGAVAVDAIARELESAPFPPTNDLLARFEATCDATASSMQEWLESTES